MSLFTRIKGLFESEEQRDAHDLFRQVRVFYTDAVHREQYLRYQVGLAPHAAGRDGLRQLADEERQVVEDLRQIIQRLGSFAGEVNRPPTPLGGESYWARLALSLEAHKQAIKDLLDEATLITDGQPELADALRRIARFEDGHCARLRALIAKSDPQALD